MRRFAALGPTQTEELNPSVNELVNAISENAAIGALITLHEPTKPMLTEAATTSSCEPKDFPGRFPRLQILTIADLLAGKKLEYPTHRDETFARAERKSKSEQNDLF